MILAILAFAGLLAGGAGLWWANETGLPDNWRTRIEEALAAQGLHTEIESVRYFPLRGIEAREVTVYSGPERERRLAHAQTIFIKVDRTKLARGIVRVEYIELSGGGLSLPVDPDDPNSKTLRIAQAGGRLLMPGGRRLELRGARGQVGGIRLEMDAMLLGYRPRMVQMPETEEARLYRRRLLAKVVEILEPWHFGGGSSPVVRLRVEGDLDDPRTMRADLAVEGRDLDHGNFRVSRLAAEGELRGRMLVLESLELEDEGGSLHGRLEFDMADREGRFEARSNLDIARLLREADQGRLLSSLSFRARPRLSARGTFHWPENESPVFQVTGRLAADDPRFGTHAAHSISTDFSWNGPRLFLDNLEIVHRDGALTGRILAEPDQIRYQVSTNLPPDLFESFFEGEPLEQVLRDFGTRNGSRHETRLKGWFARDGSGLWGTQGEAEIERMSYRGVPVHSARTRMTLGPDALDFHDGEVDFDYSAYSLRKAHGGPVSGKGTVGRVKYDSGRKSIVVEKVRGDFWPAPVVRTFNTEVADHLERYGFHHPPRLTADGEIGLFAERALTDLKVTAATDSGMDYEFAGKRLDLRGLDTRVRVLAAKTEVRDLSFGVFDGAVRGFFDILHGEGSRLRGELDWTRLSLPDLSDAYGFEHRAKGRVTGRIEFDHRGDSAAGLDGRGLIALEDGELFSVPIFGPLSPVLSAVLANRKAGFQEAKDAFCTFRVENGVLTSDDFITTTPSLVFTGNGRADLREMTLDMTIRMNARGLFGVITLPLRPFYGLFQFRGTGSLGDPKWDNVMFTSPPERENERLMEIPKARPVDPGNAPPPRARPVR